MLDMENQVINHTLTYIQEEKVPLAANIERVNNTPVFFMVGICLILLVVLAYSFWYVSHRRRIAFLDKRYDEENFFNFYFMPFELLRVEYEVENYSCGNVL